MLFDKKMRSGMIVFNQKIQNFNINSNSNKSKRSCNMIILSVLPVGIINFSFLLISLISLPIPVSAQSKVGTHVSIITKGNSRTNDTISERVLFHKRISELASENFAGRGYIDNGHIAAAEYIENKFREYGLKPLKTEEDNFQNPYFQSFEFKVNLIKSAGLIINDKILKIGDEFIPGSESPTAYSEVGKGAKAVWLNFGLPSDFERVNEKTPLKGKVIIVEQGLPKAGSNLSVLDKFTDSQKKEYSRDNFKIKLAIAHGAVAIIILHQKMTHTFSDEKAAIPIFIVDKAVFEKRFPDKEKIKKVFFAVNSEIINQKTQNVLGLVPGTTVRDSFIFILAHYDHLGRIDHINAKIPESSKGKSQKNSKRKYCTFLGANDNASGISFILSLAGYFQNNPPKYSLVFMACGAEEAGIHGSMHFTHRNPLIELSKIKKVLNFDLMGNGEEGIMTVGGNTYPQIFEVLKNLNQSLNLSDGRPFVTPLLSRANAPNSDHYPFTLKGIPSLFFYTQGGAKAYHDVNDRPENLKAPIIMRFRALMIRFIND